MGERHHNTNFSRGVNFAIFANFDFARNVPAAKIISAANGTSRNFPPAKFSSGEIFFMYRRRWTSDVCTDVLFLFHA